VTHDLPLDDFATGFQLTAERRDGAIRVAIHP